MKYDPEVGYWLVQHFHQMQLGIFPYYFNVDEYGNFRAQLSTTNRPEGSPNRFIYDQISASSYIHTDDTRGNLVVGKFDWHSFSRKKLQLETGEEYYLLPFPATREVQASVTALETSSLEEILPRFIDFAYQCACEYTRSKSYSSTPYRWVDRSKSLLEQAREAVEINLEVQQASVLVSFQPVAERYLDILLRHKFGMENWGADTCLSHRGSWVGGLFG